MNCRIPGIDGLKVVAIGKDESLARSPRFKARNHPGGLFPPLRHGFRDVTVDRVCTRAGKL